MSKFLIFTLLYTLGGILIWTQTNYKYNIKLLSNG